MLYSLKFKNMKKLILTIISSICLLGTVVAQTGVYSIVLNGTTVEVYMTPDFTGPNVASSAGNTVLLSTDEGFGASVVVSQSYTGGWGGTPSVQTNNGIDYISIASDAAADGMQMTAGVPVHLFDITVYCTAGEVSLVDNNDPNIPTGGGLNIKNSYSVVSIVPLILTDIYAGNSGTGIICAGALPVELTTFFGRNTQEGNLLLWETASELNNSGFEVEKSANGRDWKMIGWVEGKGTTSLTNNYEYLDKDPFLGDNYYRLKQVDFDGAFEYSRIINIQTEGSGVEIEVLPNPSPGDVKVTVMNPNKEKMSITLIDSAGKLIFETGLIQDLDRWKKQFNLPQKEMYFLSVRIGEEVYTEKILIIDRA